MMELFRGMKVVGHAGDGEGACLLDKQLCPTILILNLRMPKKAGIEVVIELRPQKPGAGIIVLTHSAEEENLRRALAAGAKGVEGGQNEFDRTHNCGCPALPQRAILILYRALHNPPSVRNRSVE